MITLQLFFRFIFFFITMSFIPELFAGRKEQKEGLRSIKKNKLRKRSLGEIREIMLSELEDDGKGEIENLSTMSVGKHSSTTVTKISFASTIKPKTMILIPSTESDHFLVGTVKSLNSNKTITVDIVSKDSDKFEAIIPKSKNLISYKDTTQAWLDKILTLSSTKDIRQCIVGKYVFMATGSVEAPQLMYGKIIEVVEEGKVAVITELNENPTPQTALIEHLRIIDPFKDE